MTSVRVSLVDVYVLRRDESGLRCLVLHRAPGGRCPGSWETVHGSIEAGEKPEAAAIRELREEAGLAVSRLYSISVQPFYLHKLGMVTAAVFGFASIRFLLAYVRARDYRPFVYYRLLFAALVAAVLFVRGGGVG